LDYVIGLGANLGAREAAFASAITRLDATAGCRVLCVSPFYESEPIGPPQPLYLNAAVRLESSLAPEPLFEALLEIERAHGRVRRERWGPRTLDLDILWATESFEGGQLTIPHTCLVDRSFALAPLLDVAPELTARYGPRLAALGGPPPRAACDKDRNV
jgi:2-amino-4-hydroxy-6-hydroxymethyldihydropteridine diphosphokinase